MALNFGSNLLLREKEFQVFDYRDVLGGNGYLTFYGGDSYNTAGALGYILSPAIFASTNKFTNIPETTRVVTTFNIKVGKNMKLKGRAVLSMLLRADNYSGNNTIIATLKKYDGISETTIKQIGYLVWNVGITGTGWNFKRVCFSDEVTETIIKKGEYLRLIIDITAGNGDGTVTGFDFFHDPERRMSKLTAASTPFAAYSDSSDLTLNIPFKIEE